MEKVMNEKIIMNYEVVELLHKSSSWGNIVFKVKPQNKEKLYVLKCFPKIENGLQKLIFKREIEALRTLNVCEGIVKLRDSSTELYPFKENECYGGILMDYVPGETLDHINWNKYTQLKKYEICLQILKAVNNAHSNNVIHRDLKPSNIIYDKYADKVTLIDFGTSKIKTVMDSETTMPLYSEGYSAPELILGKNITEKCDYYSIGIIMSEILLSQKNGSDINSRIEEWTGRKEIKDILLSLVQEKPENRPESLENVIVILERLIGNLNTSSCSYSIAIDSRKLVQLKRNSIVEENMTMVQFTNSFLKNEFKQSYGYYDVKDQQYVITGEKMIMKCGYDENEQKMYVTYVGKITADRRNINIKRSFRIVGQISFVLNSRDNGYDPQDNHQLVVMFKNHQDDNKQYQLQEEKFENLFGGWEIGLTEAVEKEKGKSAIIKYDKYEINGGQLIFNLIDCEKKSIDELMPPTRFVVESQGQKGVIYTEVGNFEEVVCDDDSVKIVLSLTKGRLKPTVRQLLNKNTPLLEDFRAKTMAYKRQFRAIFDLKKDEYSARSLKDIILCLDEPEEIKTISQPSFISKVLNQSQKQAVMKALNTENICLIQCLKEVERLVETIKAADFKKKKKQKEIDELQMKILSSRRLLDGEVKVLLDYLAENAQQVEMSVDNIDDWAYDKNFVGKLSHYVGKATLKIKYQSSNNIGKAIERIKQGHDVAEYKKHEHGYFICWKFDDIYEIYGLPSEQIAIDRDTTCIVVDYYLRNLNSSV